jgi:predicted DNA-binding transcriptional regulator YafY
MNAKLQRHKKIRSFLRSQSSPQTITEVYEALVNRLGQDVSRKTVERDIDELIESRIVILMPGLPTRYQLAACEELEIILTVQEIGEILSKLEEKSELKLKLKKMIAFEL